ncbi:MAG: response regulator, partial [Alistipes sp.]|nr:response regulator [Alistipes sp.]
MKCIAIDDEPIALSIIGRYCERRGNLELETYSSPRQGMRRIREARPDVVFLDIEMNGVSGLELARELPPSCCLIFTTAYAHYALDGFDVDAVDFLHKPYFYERFNRAVHKAEQWLRMHDLLDVSVSSARQLCLKSEYKNVTVCVDTIVYVESIDNYVKVHLSDG